MKYQLRSAIERVLRRLPVSRAVYAQQDILQRRIERLETALVRTQQGLHANPINAAAQVAPHDPHRLEALVPVSRTMEERTAMTIRCRDADCLPRVAGAG